MFIYLLCFFISSLLLFYANKLKNTSYKKFIIFLALIIPCVLAGLRADTIGTDVKIYLKNMFSAAENSSSFYDYLNHNVYGIRNVKDYEIGFTSLVYFITKIFKSMSVVMFFIEVLIIFPVYVGLKKIEVLKDKVWFAMLVYYLIFFNNGLNLMRQYIGMSIAFCGICLLISHEKKSFIKCIFLIIVSFLFHKSSIISLSIILIYLILKKKDKKNISLKFGDYDINLKPIFALLLVSIGMYFLFNMDIIKKFIVSMDEFERYSLYVYSGFSISDFSIMKVFPIIFIFITLSKKFIKKYDDSYFYIVIFCFAYIIFGQLGNVTETGSRISTMYSIFNVITYTLLVKTPSKARNRDFCCIFIIMYLLAYWIIMFAYNGYSQTIPYVFGV